MNWKLIASGAFAGILLFITLETAESADNLIQPGDLLYIGAFRLPDSSGTPDNVNWGWSNWSAAATLFPCQELSYNINRN